MYRKDIVKIYVYLPDEAVDVWAPVEAASLGGDIYKITSSKGYDEELERWEFPPGSIVACEPRRSESNGTILVAVGLAGH